MKKTYSIIALLAFTLASNAQVFWTENFGTGCNQGQLASAFTGANGVWTTASTGTNDPYANTFYVGAQEAGNAVGACGTGCTGTVDASLHVGAVVIPGFVVADEGASYNAGGACGFGYCVITNTRAQSPVINCSGKTSITISFAYLENGATTLDDAGLWYSPDGGTTWTLLDNMAKTPLGSCAPQGTWTAYSFSLPVTADNNSNVKIGFNWTNNDDGAGTDPSFAVDDITLSTLSVGVADSEAPSVNIYASGSNVIIKSSDAVKFKGVFDVVGRSINASLENNSIINMENQPAGIYFVRVEVKGQTFTKKVFIK
ncbi:MAG: T9SS type A sorting domain-containing protein [Bacteroidetes bacterium]|nr:T9SS type A sorting domain-containing protein [Bacteroidota bacterium]